MQTAPWVRNDTWQAECNAAQGLCAGSLSCLLPFGGGGSGGGAGDADLHQARKFQLALHFARLHVQSAGMPSNSLGRSARASALLNIDMEITR